MTAQPYALTLEAVRAWGRARGHSDETLAAGEADAVRYLLSNLLDGLRREYEGVVSIGIDGRFTTFSLGGLSRIQAELRGCVDFSPARIRRVWRIASPGEAVEIDTAADAVNALVSALAESGVPLNLEALASDMLNAAANLLLDRLIAEARGGCARSPEPAWQGHTHFPFPGLRIGPTAEDVEACSSLSEEPVPFPIVRVGGLELLTRTGLARARWEARWTGDPPLEEDEIVLHPWHMSRSGPIRELLDEGRLDFSGRFLPVRPLASQRTCSIEATGYHLKLPVDATITGERRLLYPANLVNAPIVSAYAKAACVELGRDVLDCQADIASFRHIVDGLAPYLSAIIREPLPAGLPGDMVAAINLWAGPELAGQMIPGGDPDAAEEFFHHYCVAMFSGAVPAWVRYGIGLEPHIQNSILRFERGRPSGLIIRDLDSTILDRSLSEALMERSALRLPDESWSVMPSPSTGCLRLAHALFHGHLGTAGGALITRFGAKSRRLMEAREAAWARVISTLDARERRRAARIRRAAGTVKRMMTARLQRTMEMEFSPSRGATAPSTSLSATNVAE